MTSTLNPQNSSVPKGGRSVHAFTIKDPHNNRKSRLIDNKDLYDDTDDPGYSDSSLPEIRKGKQKRMTKTRKVIPGLKIAEDHRQLQLPEINGNPSLVGSENKDRVAEKDQVRKFSITN